MGGASALGGSGGGGSGGGGSGGGTSGSARCPNPEACGGDVVGTWNVRSSCLTVAGRADLTMAGLSCQSAPVEGALQVTGAWSATANGTYWDKTTTTGSAHYTLDQQCTMLSGTRVTCQNLGGAFLALGFSTASCEDASGGGCTCVAELKQTGSMGSITWDIMTSGAYKTSGSKLTFDGGNPHAYCVSGDQLTITPNNPALPTTGAIVFQKQ